MDHLTSVYRSRMRLFPDRPDVLTAGRWCWCPPGAVAIPYLSRFASMHFDYEGFSLGADEVGEVETIPGYTSGVPNARYTGQHWCGDEAAWRDGVPFALRGTPVADADGVPLCCAVVPRKGGDQVGIVEVIPDLATAGLWWRPEDLEPLGEGTVLRDWPDATGHGRDGLRPSPQTAPVITRGAAGWLGALYDRFSTLDPAVDWELGTGVTTYAVFQPISSAGSVPALALKDGSFSGAGIPEWATDLVYYQNSLSILTQTQPRTLLAVYIEGVRRGGADAEIHWQGSAIQSGAIDPLGVNVFHGTRPASIGGLGDFFLILYELIIFPRRLSDEEHYLVGQLLLQKYAIGNDNVLYLGANNPLSLSPGEPLILE